MEWLSSPIVYRDDTGFRSDLKSLLPIYYEPQTCLHHYIHMAQNNFLEYLKGPTVWIKEYLYVLRPILASRWIEQDRGPVPMEFNQLLVTIGGRTDLIREIQALIARKKAGEELDRGPTIPTIGTFMAEEMQRPAVAIPRKPGAPPDLKRLQDLFASRVAGM